MAFVPFSGNAPNSADFEIFAEEFAGAGEAIASPRNAEYRPCGLAQGADGSLYIADSQKGTLWRIIYTGRDVASR